MNSRHSDPNIRRAVFLDRDGIINHDTGYLWRVEHFVFMEGIFAFCRLAVSQGYRLIVVTNQAGIGRGYYNEKDFLHLTRWMCERFDQEEAPLTDIYYCPYHARHGLGVYRRDSFDRKPNPGMLLKAARRHGIALSQSLLVGDKESDMEAGYNAGIPERYLVAERCEEAHGRRYATHRVRSIDELTALLQARAESCPPPVQITSANPLRVR